MTSIDCKNSMNEFPINFDARLRWKECNVTLNHVYNQGSCSSCWVNKNYIMVVHKYIPVIVSVISRKIAKKSLLASYWNLFYSAVMLKISAWYLARNWVGVHLTTFAPSAIRACRLRYQAEIFSISAKQRFFCNFLGAITETITDIYGPPYALYFDVSPLRS